MSEEADPLSSGIPNGKMHQSLTKLLCFCAYQHLLQWGDFSICGKIYPADKCHLTDENFENPQKQSTEQIS